MSDRLSKFSPLTEASYYILLSLTEPLHGYGIIKKVEAMSGGRVRLAAGTLYGALSMMLSNKLIVLIGEDDKNRRRKLYRMTDAGRGLVSHEIRRLQEMTENGLREMGGNA